MREREREGGSVRVTVSVTYQNLNLSLHACKTFCDPPPQKKILITFHQNPYDNYHLRVIKKNSQNFYECQYDK